MNTAIYTNSLPRESVGEANSEIRKPSLSAAEANQNADVPQSSNKVEIVYDDREVYGGY